MARPVSNQFFRFLTPEIRALLDQAPSRYVRAQVLGFAGYLCREKRPVSLANQADLLAYGTEIAGLGIPRPKQAARDAAHAWNQMAASVPSWPQTRLLPPISSRALLRYEDLPPELRADCDLYLNTRAEAGEEDLFADNPSDPWAPATVKDRRGKICQLALHYVQSGGRLADLTSLGDFFKGNSHKRILKHIEAQTGGRPNGHAANLAHNLLIIGKYYTHAPDEVLGAIRNAKNKFRPKKSGMTPKNRARLRLILEDKALPQLLKLPSLFLETLDMSTPTLSDAVRLQSALAIQIELVAPMRAKNLAALDIERQLDFVSTTQCHIIIEGDEVKNDQTLNYVLGVTFIKLYRIYVEIYRPLLLKDQKSSSLFISRTGRTKNPAELGAQMQSFIKDQIGLRMNVHLFRHLTGYIYLLHYPGQYEPVRQLLGHKDIRTTINFYVGLEEDAAFKRYGDILERMIANTDTHQGAQHD